MHTELYEDALADRPFEIRPYPKSELAQLYFPHLPRRLAMKKLQRWIARCRPLRHALYDEGPESRNEHVFTRRQVRLLVRHLDVP